MKKRFEVLEGSRDQLERHALEAVIEDSERFEALLQQMEPAAPGTLRLIAAERAPEPESAQGVPVP